MVIVKKVKVVTFQCLPLKWSVTKKEETSNKSRTKYL